MTTLTERAVKYVDERLGAASFARAALRKIFPDHWSFLLGEIALFALVVLIFTGTFMTFFYTPSAEEVIYDGSYAPLQGREVSAAFESVLRLSFDVRGGLLFRQVHHWGALVFVAAIVIHLCRIFFTGAFRRPREFNWLIGITLLLLAMAEGLTGYTLPDDLLSGVGLRIIYSGSLSIPVIGPELTYLVFGGEFPDPDTIPRFFVAHIFLFPAILVALVIIHVAIVFWQKHTQYRGPGRTERNVVGEAFWPGQTFKSVSLLFLVSAVLAGLGGLAQINPIWEYGPFVPYNVTSPAQPDWYIGFLDGGLRLAPPWRFQVFGYEISELFLPAIVLPGLLFTLLIVWPWIERRLTRDRDEHHLLDRPRDRPVRTATGMAGLVVFFVMFLEAGNDILGVLLGVPVETITRILQWSFVLAPVFTWLVTYAICQGLRTSGVHPARATAGLRLRRTPEGGYETIDLEPTAPPRD